MTDIERFNLIDEVRCVCAQQGIACAGDSWTPENLAWIFEKARLQIMLETEYTKWRKYIVGDVIES